MQVDDHGLRKTIHFASRCLTPVEQRYSQIEREGLAIVWACEHLNIYRMVLTSPYILITNPWYLCLQILDLVQVLVYKDGHCDYNPTF